MTPRAKVTCCELLPSFRRHLLAKNRGPGTVETYSEAVKQLEAFLAKGGRETDIGAIGRRDVEAFEADLLERHSPATAANRHKSLVQFFKWLVREGELERSPMEGMGTPRVPPKPVPVLSTEELRALLKACEGGDIPERRDLAIIRLFIDTGLRLSELTNLRYSGEDPERRDVSLDQQLVFVTGKGGKSRVVPIGDKTVHALDRYLRVRRTMPDAASEWLWLGLQGPYTKQGIQLVVAKRAKRASIGHVNVHRFRHTFAHRFLASGGEEGHLMALCGWTSREMLDRYGASAADERAREAHRRLAPGDKL